MTLMRFHVLQGGSTATWAALHLLLVSHAQLGISAQSMRYKDGHVTQVNMPLKACQSASLVVLALTRMLPQRSASSVGLDTSVPKAPHLRP